MVLLATTLGISIGKPHIDMLVKADGVRARCTIFRVWTTDSTTAQSRHISHAEYFEDKGSSYQVRYRRRGWRSARNQDTLQYAEAAFERMAALVVPILRSSIIPATFWSLQNGSLNAIVRCRYSSQVLFVWL